MPDEQQPPGGPTPTPSPKPAQSTLIGAINKFEEGGAMIVPGGSNYIAPFFVPQSYLEECNPEVGGYFVVFSDVACFMSATNYEERYG